MSSNARCNIVFGLWVTAMMAIGALSAYGAAVFVNKWVGVLVVAVIGFGSAPDFEMAIAVVPMTVIAWLVADVPALILFPGGFAGFMLMFRTGDLLTWLYPPLREPPEDS